MKQRIGLLLLCLLLFGCASPRSWTYQAAEPVSREPLLSRSVAVPPLIDARPPQNDNRLMLYLIPLWPYGWQEMNAPEAGVNAHLTSGLWQFKPTEDIAKAFAMEVNNRHIFKEAFFTHRESEGDLVLRSTLTSTRYDGTIYSYGLSAYAGLTWILGLPAGKVKNDLAFKMVLEDPTAKKILWEKSYSAEHDEGRFWLYGMPSDFWYDKMLKDLMPTILSEMEQAVKQYVAAK